jgi:hypothetical protein
VKPRELKEHKDAAKKLTELPAFQPMKRGKLPKPFNKLGGGRMHSTKQIRVSTHHQVLFWWRDGETLADRSFYGYLMCDLAQDALGIVFEFHWHPSHKGIHCKVPCETELNYTNRFLVGAPELGLSGSRLLDPRNENDRQQLMIRFCDACGLTLAAKEDQVQPDLWNF